MLKSLRIQNIILVEQADITFSAGLNIITGETGAGKSAIMNGLGLALGERTDIGMIRKGHDKGVVEAIFNIDQYLGLKQLLVESGIDHHEDEDLIVRREISLSGKHRLFINNQSAQLTLLRKVGDFLGFIIGQHATHQLFSIDYHRSLLDLYGKHEDLLNDYQRSYTKENLIRLELTKLINTESQRLREIDIYKTELEELDDAQLKEGEDEALFEEYSLLVNSKEIFDKVSEINRSLSGDKNAVLASLNRNKTILEALIKLDPHFKDIFETYQQAFIEIQEIAHSIQRYQESLQDNPERVEIINERLTLINRLKRKYGNSIQDIQTYYQEIKKKLKILENADIQIEELQNELKETEAITNSLAQRLTKKRQETAKHFEKDIIQQLNSLNMPKARFVIEVSGQNRVSTGDDKVEFFLQPNVGEHQIALKEAASGGEISRIQLALQTLLAGKANIPTLIFDEVDANIGGETASIVGDKLREIGKQHQVICVTHFPQVAKKAHHHLQIAKIEREGRTFTEVQILDASSQQRELDRMVGKGQTD